MTDGFSYHAAFARNLGWVTQAEQNSLRGKRVAIAGMGGVGGVHLLTLARLGIGAFHIADFDTFDIANFNRQAGAMVSTLGQPKVAVLAQMARDINPELDIKQFPDGIHDSNLAEFFAGVDLYVDGLDFFAFRRAPGHLRRLRPPGHSRHHGGAAGHGHGRAQLHAGRHDVRRVFWLGRLAGRRKGPALSRRPGAGRLARPLPGRPVRHQPEGAARAVDHHGLPAVRGRGRHGSA